MFSLKKARVPTAVMLLIDDMLDEKDVLMTFDELEVQNWPLQISSSSNDFSLKFCCRRAADNELPAYVTCHMRSKTKDTNSFSSSFSISDLKLFIDDDDNDQQCRNFIDTPRKSRRA